MKYFIGLVLTLMVYTLATMLYRKTKITFLHPVLVSVSLLIILLMSLDIEYESYNFSSQLLTKILDPVVVCLGIPLYKNRKKIKELLIQVTDLLGGDQSLTIIAVILTGIIGATIAPYVMKIGRVKNETAMGIGIGAASHGIGTSKAVEMG